MAKSWHNRAIFCGFRGVNAMLRVMGALWIGLLFGQMATGQENNGAKIVVIPTALDHAWNTHMYDQECRLLVKCLNQNPGVRAVLSPDLDWPKDPKVLEGARSVVFYSRPAGDIVFSPERRAQAKKLFDSGVGFVAIHWATGTNEASLGQDYLDLLGGWFHFNHSGLKVGEYTLKQLDAAHPVCRGWKPFALTDEIYLNLKFHPEATPLLRMTVEGKEQTVAWAHERKNQQQGRSFGTTLGHFHANFTKESFRKMLLNGILWTARVEVPENGADVRATDAELKLPPPPPVKK